MILVFETNWTGTTHAPGNSATVQAIARAWPEQDVRLHADPTHLAELRRDPMLMALPRLSLQPIDISPLWQGRPQIVSPRRAWHEFRVVAAALKGVPPDEPCLVVLISTTATGGFAAAWAAFLSGRRAGVQLGFHGNLNDALGWRPRNPLTRAFDTRAALESRYPVPLRFLVLEEGIRDALLRVIPAAAGRTDVLPLPINPAEATAEPSPLGSSPVRIGFVGLGTTDKGVDIFLDIARRVGGRHPGRVAFVHVGRIPEGTDPAAFEGLAHEPATGQLARAEFVARLRSLDYVLLPFRRGYYDLSASGALLDAVTWLKPVVAMRVPLTERFFADYGDIGYLCDDEAALEAMVERIVAAPDPARHARQVEALRRAREARGMPVLAARYRALIAAGFPGLLDAPAGPRSATEPAR
jgi:glycosyltransferase involved in cell wall biosynthesis